MITKYKKNKKKNIDRLNFFIFIIFCNHLFSLTSIATNNKSQQPNSDAMRACAYHVIRILCATALSRFQCIPVQCQFR